MKMKHFAFAAFIALMVAGMVSCKSKNEPKLNEGNNYSGEVVKSEFSISLPNQAASSRRRMPSAIVQNDGLDDFQGMTDIILVPFKKNSTIIGSDTRLGTNIALADIGDGSAFKVTGTAKLSKAKLYTDVSIPLMTSSFLFYGQSKAVDATSDAQSGVLQANNLDFSTPSSFSFTLKPIKSTVASVTDATAGSQLLAYLNSVANATAEIDAVDVAWKDYTANAGLEEMFNTYKTMKGLTSFGVSRMMTDLRKSLEPFSDPMSVAIKTAIESTTYVESVGAAPAFTITLKDAINDFPHDQGLPDGSVSVVWNTSDKEFKAATSKMYSEMNMAPLNKYTYPASLWYYTNSVISTSNTSKQALYNRTDLEWSSILAQHEAAKSVSTLTRAVAIDNVIQYAVARLDVMVKQSSEALTDRAGAEIAHEGYQLTGVLVGGQKEVDFEFKPITEAIEYTIYDSEMTSTIVTDDGSFSDANSTLVLETADNVPVYIAVEFLNNSGKDFNGVDGLIPAGGKFYMVAKLDGTSVATEVHENVFKQDYTTTAKLTMGSLENAYSTIPDLRTPQLELGLSVDLTWEAGNVYNVTL